MARTSILSRSRRHRLRLAVLMSAVAALVGASLTVAIPQAGAAETPLSQGRPATASSAENAGTPASHPVPVPKPRQVLRYPVNGDPARFRLASGPGFTMHGDFFNAWPEAEMERRVRDCIRPIIKCGADGHP
ncbi:hypothetical protein [Streptosporangium canum]|uniref:hypothetical protein n=1 Tax=Streptosporangium canum TaxID=324952 RepID=UPI0037B38CCE